MNKAVIEKEIQKYEDLTKEPSVPQDERDFAKEEIIGLKAKLDSFRYSGEWIKEKREWSGEFSDNEDDFAVFYSTKSDGSTRVCITDKLYKADQFTSEIEELEDGFYRFRSTDHNDREAYGVINYAGKIIISPLYDEIEPFGDYFKVLYENWDEEKDSSDWNIYKGWGLINKYGEWEINPVYDSIDEYDNFGLAYKDDTADLLCTYLNSTLVQLKNVDDARDCIREKLMAFVTVNGKEGLYSFEKEEFILHPEFETLEWVNKEIRSFIENNIPACDVQFLIMGIKENSIIFFNKQGEQEEIYDELITGYDTQDAVVYITATHKIFLEKEIKLLKVVPISLLPQFLQ